MHIVKDPNPDEFYLEQQIVIECNSKNELVDVKPSAYTPDSIDELLNKKIALTRGPDELIQVGTVLKRLKDKDGNPVGRQHDIAALDTRLYEVIWPYGSTEPLFANTMADNIYDGSTKGTQNAYLHANCWEKICITAGREFGSNAGKTMVITKALYGLKSSSAAF